MSEVGVQELDMRKATLVLVDEERGFAIAVCALHVDDGLILR